MAKASLDLAVRPTGETWQVANEAAGLPELIAQLSALPPALVVLEATGGYEHLVVAALATAGLPVVVADPRQVRDFGRAVGQLAKTDRIDAALLALFAERVGPEPRPLPDEASCKMLVTQLLAHMSDMTYTGVRAPGDKPLVWLHGEIKTPPFSPERPVWRPGSYCDGCRPGRSWLSPTHGRCRRWERGATSCGSRMRRRLGGIVYRLDSDAGVIAEVFSKKTAATPQHMIETCQRRLRAYDQAAEED